MSNRKIAIVGSYGCGKTVLLTVLTHRFQNPTEDGCQICPDNESATKFCIEKWNDLQNGEWPVPTPPAENPPVYRWKLRKDAKEMQLVTSDIAGEAWRAFITERVAADSETTVRSSWDSVKEKWSKIKNELSSASINKHITTVENLLKTASGIFLLLDLSQIIDQEPGYDMAMFLPTALVQHMKNIKRSHIPITLVLSKTDKYRYMYDEMGDWQKVVESCIPWAPRFERIIPVSAVADTKTITGKDGNAKSIPAPGFTSEGIKDLYDNIWNTMADAWWKEMLHALLRFCLIDVPVLLALWGVYQLVFDLTPIPILCSIYAWMAILGYCGIKICTYMRKIK